MSEGKGVMDEGQSKKKPNVSPFWKHFTLKTLDNAVGGAENS